MKKETVALSIIIPIYNCEKYLKKCVKSVLQQEPNKCEIILINDGSTDNSLKICNQLEKEYSNIRVYSQTNSGVSAARNLGLTHANGKYVTFMDSDDYIGSGYFAEFQKLINAETYDLINFGFFSEVEDKRGNIISQDKINFSKKKYNSINELRKDLVKLWDAHMLYNVWNKIYLKSIIDKNYIRFPKKNFGEDMEFNALYLSKINRLYNSEKCYYHYIKERQGSLTQKYNKNLFEIRKREYYFFNNYFEKNNIRYQDYIEFSSRRFIERVVGCIENTCSSKEINLLIKMKITKKIVSDPLTRDTVKIARPKSKKMKILLIPIKMRCSFASFIMGNIIGMIRHNSPSLFNKLKNRR